MKYFFCCAKKFAMNKTKFQNKYRSRSRGNTFAHKTKPNFNAKHFMNLSPIEREREGFSYSLNTSFCLVLTRIGMLNRHEKKNERKLNFKLKIGISLDASRPIY